jgi:hypothetical protein
MSRAISAFFNYVWFWLVIALLFAAAVFSCPSSAEAQGLDFSLGAVGVYSHGLGYEELYGGGTARLAVLGKRFVLRAEGELLNAEKTIDEDGFGMRGSAVAGVKAGAVELLAGFYAAKQVEESWTKREIAPRVELGWNMTRMDRLSLYADGPLDQVDWSAGLRAESCRKVCLVSTGEYVWFDEEKVPIHAEHPMRASLAVLWRFK